MSLLLDALKRAEAAKQQGAAGLSNPSDAAADRQPGFDTTPVVNERLMTRDRLPDITQPLEILSDDLPSAAAPHAERRSPGASAGAPIERRTPKEDNSGWAAREDVESRAAARQLFEAKSVDYDPYRFVKIVGGLAIGVLVGYGGYVYYQLQPRSIITATNSAAPARTTVSAPAPSAAPAPAVAIAPQPTPPAAVSTSPAPVVTANGPSSPAAQVAAAPPSPERASPAPASPAPASPTPAVTSAPPVISAPPIVMPPARAPSASVAASPRPRTSSERTSAAPPRATTAPRTGPVATVSRGESPIDRAYAAYESGDVDAARQGYQQALRADPTSRDALLGLAALDMKAQNYAAAEARFIKLLELDPRDAYAHAGMMTLRAQSDPVLSESRTKSLLAAQPEADFLNFTLGNQYAAQSRWSEAQGAYFKAYSARPDHPDYAFNLAVSLDHLRQSKLASEYYQKALAAAANRQTAFNKAQVETRIRELAQ